MKLLLLVLLSFCFIYSLADEARCRDFKTCGSCLGFAGDVCVWCSAPNITQRCQSDAYMKLEIKKKKVWCANEYLQLPKPEKHSLIMNKPLGSASGNVSAVQFRPQKMTAKLGPGQKVTFPMSFKHAKHFPLDVYYLMDYSFTMNEHVEALKIQSEYVKSELTKLTNNVHFGLGSFVEKPAYPFVGKENTAYAFRHHLNLTENIKLFGQSLDKKDNFSNYDLPEASLDALMQVMACEKELGWRPNANRIIVVCTDATYHSAGDGKMVLAYKLNDMKCHLNGSGYYNYDLIQDYPSISQINLKAMDGKFKIIFATLKAVRNTYAILAASVAGAESAILKKESAKTSNIIDIIKAAYLASTRYVTMKHQFPPFVQLALSPDCTRPRSGDCSLGHDAELNMMATLKVTSCPPNVTDYHQVLHVGPVEGGIEDKLQIDLEIHNCQCGCETDNSGIVNSPKCSNLGTFQCGICSCNKERSGDMCECDESKANSKTDLNECRNVNDTKFCSGRGKCGCKKCACYTGFSGKYCQFDDNSCARTNNQLCSGHGKCTLGSCKCDSELWTGEDCGCSTLDHNCYAPYSKEKCSGKGKCVCNECVCEKQKGKEERYSGVFCDDCEECAEKRCKDLEEYARCNFLFNKTHCDEQHNHAANTEVQMLNKSEINTSKWPTAKWCRTNLDKDRSIVFLHIYDKFHKKLIVIIQKGAEEAPKADIWVPVGIAIGSVVLIGLLTVLVWKLMVDAMDAREYNKFQKRAQNEGFDVSDNPLYQPASVNFSNPTYHVVDNALVENRG